MDPLRTCSKPCYFDLIFTILDLLRVLEEAAARPHTSCLWAGRTCSEPLKPMPGTSNFGYFDHFSYWKSQFLSFCLSGGQWKCHFDPILTPFEPSWAQTFGSWPKCAYLGPLPGWTLEGPWGTPFLTLNLTILDPFWGSWMEAAADPLRAAFGLEDLLRASQTHARDPKFWSFWPLFLLKSQFLSFCLSGSVKMPFWPYFDPIWALLSPNLWPWPKCAYLGPLPGWTLEGPWGTLNLTCFDHFGPLLRVLEGCCG